MYRNKRRSFHNCRCQCYRKKFSNNRQKRFKKTRNWIPWKIWKKLLQKNKPIKSTEENIRDHIEDIRDRIEKNVIDS